MTSLLCEALNSAAPLPKDRFYTGLAQSSDQRRGFRRMDSSCSPRHKINAVFVTAQSRFLLELKGKTQAVLTQSVHFNGLFSCLILK